MRFLTALTLVCALALAVLAQEAPATKTLQFTSLNSVGVGVNAAGEFSYAIKPGTQYHQLLPRVYGGLSPLEMGDGSYFGMETNDLLVKPGLFYLAVIPHQKLATFTKTGEATVRNTWLKPGQPAIDGPAEETQVLLQRQIIRNPDAVTVVTYPSELLYAYVGNGPGELLQHAGIGFVSGRHPDIPYGVAYDLQRVDFSKRRPLQLSLQGPEIGATFSSKHAPYWYVSWVTVGVE